MPLAFDAGDLVADALAGDLAFELGEGEQHIEGQTPHRGRGVELLRHRDKGDVMGVEDVDDLGEIGERAGEAIDLVDDNDLNLAGLNVRQQPLQGRALHRAAGEAAVVIHVRKRGPAGVALTDGSSHRFGVSPALASVSACGLRLRQLRLIVSPYWEARSDSGYESKKGQAEEALIDF